MGITRTLSCSRLPRPQHSTQQRRLTYYKHVPEADEPLSLPPSCLCPTPQYTLWPHLRHTTPTVLAKFGAKHVLNIRTQVFSAPSSLRTLDQQTSPAFPQSRCSRQRFIYPSPKTTEQQLGRPRRNLFSTLTLPSPRHPQTGYPKAILGYLPPRFSGSRL